MTEAFRQGPTSIVRVLAGLLLFIAAIASGLVSLSAMREFVSVFLLGAERQDLPRSIVFEATLPAYLAFALLRRLFLRDWRLTVVPRFALEGFARAWGIAVSILIAANVADLTQGPWPVFGAELVRDFVLYGLVILILLIPALIALALAKRSAPG